MKYIDADKLVERLEEMKRAEYENCGGVNSKTGALQEVQELITSLQQAQPSLPIIKGWIARDDADRLGLYDQKPTRKTELGAFSGIVHSWVIGDTWIGRFSLDQTAKTLFPNLCWKNDPIEVELIIKPIQGQPEVNLEKEEFVGVAESPSKTFPRVNEFDCGGSYRH